MLQSRNLSQIPLDRRCSVVNAGSEAVDGMKATTKIIDTPFDFEATFRAQYERIARVIARVVQDPARAEELAVEVFFEAMAEPAGSRRKCRGLVVSDRGTQGFGRAATPYAAQPV